MRPRRLAPLTTVALVLVSVLPGPAARATDKSRPAPALCQGLRATIRGTDGADDLTGTPGPDVISAGPGRDTVRGLGGDDVICGGNGADHLDGGSGNDRLYGQGDTQGGDRGGVTDEGDTLQGGPGDDVLDPGPHLDSGETPETFTPDVFDFSDAPRGVTVELASSRGGAPGTARGDGDDTLLFTSYGGVQGSSFGDYIEGSPYADRLVGGGGSDILHGLAGPDRLDVDVEGVTHAKDADLLDGGPGNDLLSSFGGDDLMVGGSGGDNFQTNGSQDPVTILGGPGRDLMSVVISRQPGQVIEGGPGVDQVFLSQPGAATRETVVTVDQATGTMTTTEPGLTARGEIGGFEQVDLDSRGVHRIHWEYVGTGAAEELESTGLSLRASMGDGNDQVYGTHGDDVIDGGSGRDTVRGEGGTDLCTHVEVRQECPAG